MSYTTELVAYSCVGSRCILGFRTCFALRSKDVSRDLGLWSLISGHVRGHSWQDVSLNLPLILAVLLAFASAALSDQRTSLVSLD